ncbi:MAG: cytochrome c [Rhodobacteraceae bacterium]|nr:MAG: cytochrome c [Paracoccaceae bacterium]
MTWQSATGAGLPAIFSAMAIMSAGAALSDDLELGSALYDQHCAACHGVDLEGAPDWQRPGPDGHFPAPPHDETGHTWHHGDQMLFEYTKHGGQAYLDDMGVAFNSGMPAFGDVLRDTEIEAILAYIRSTWPARIQEIQAARTAAESTE